MPTNYSGLADFQSGFLTQFRLGDFGIADILHEAWKTLRPLPCVSPWRMPLEGVRPS